MVVVIALFVLAVIVAIILPMSQKAITDPFKNLTIEDRRKGYADIGISFYNKFSDTADIERGISWNYASVDEGNDYLKKASQTSDLVSDPNEATFQGIEVRAPTMKIAQKGTVYNNTNTCETKKGRDMCSRLGSGDFAQCGVCIKGGTAYTDPSNPGKHIGGLLLLDDDKAQVDISVRGTSNPPEYRPSLGECPPGYFFADRAACEKAVNRENCKEIGASGGFDGGKSVEGKGIDAASCAAVPGISPQTYVYDSKNRKFGLALRVLTPARTGRTFVQVFQNGARIAQGAGMGGTEFTVDVSDKKEGDTLQISIDMEQLYVPYTGAQGYRAVLLQWENSNGRIVDKFEQSITALNGQGYNADGVLANMRKYGTFGGSKIILIPKPGEVIKDSYIILSTACDYGETSQKFSPGRYDMHELENIPNDSASSIRVYGGATAKMYSHAGFGGSPVVAKKNIRCFVDIGFNDVLSSLIVEPGNQKTRSAISADSQWFWIVGAPRVLRIDTKVPGTFLAPVYPEDRKLSSKNPLVTERSTFEMLRASPCMKPDQKPGQYGLACLKTLYLAAGGIADGTIARGGLEKLNSYGSAEAITSYLENLYQTATRGRKASGTKATMTEINDAAMKLFGFELVSPCEDISESESGQIILTPKVGGLEVDCLDYLWKNTGNDRSRGNEDNSRKTSLPNTYISIRDRYSGLRASEGTKRQVEATPFQTCQPSGTMSPMTAKGETNWPAVTAANAKGSIQNIQNFYNEIHSAANYKGGDKSSIISHDDALEKCYGIKRATSVPKKEMNCTSRMTEKVNMYGAWIGELPGVPVSAKKKLNDGRTVYLLQHGRNVDMATEDGEEKLYEGKVDDFDPNKWKSYTRTTGGCFLLAPQWY